MLQTPPGANQQPGLLPCFMVNSLTKNTEEQCKFIIDNDCLEDEATIDYVYLVFCEISYEMRGLAISLIAFLVIVLFLNLSAVADEFLCPSLLTVARNLRMSDSLAGVTLLAFGNGCPDIFSSLAAASSGRPELIVGELLGAGIFCTSIVAGLIFINNDFKTARRPLLRDTSFYLLAVYLMWLYCFQGQITFYGSIAFIVVYVIYLLIALSGQAIHSRMRGEYPLAETQAADEQGGGSWSSSSGDEKKGPPKRASSQLVCDENEAGAVRLSSANEKLGDAYESWFKWRDEMGRRRSSVKREQIELAKRELDARLTSGQFSTGGGGGCDQLKSPTTILNNHFENASQNCLGCVKISCHEKATTIVELAQRQGSRGAPQGETNVISICDHEGQQAAAKKMAIIQEEIVRVVAGAGGQEAGQDKRVDEKNKHTSNSFSLTEFDAFLFHINPINSIVWAESRWLVRIMSILRAPLLFVTILTVPVVDNEKRNGNWCRLLNSLHCFMVPGAIIMLTRLVGAGSPEPVHAGATPAAGLLPAHSNGSTPPTGGSSSDGGEPISMTSSLMGQLDGLVSLRLILLLAPGFCLALFVFNTTHSLKPPKYHALFAYFGFVMSVTWIYVLATEIISLLKTIGIIFSMTDTAIGLGVLAWGNSLGDIVANLTLAEAGYARMALGASIGAPLLNLLLGFGLSFSLSLKPGEMVAIEYSATITLLAGTLSLVLILLMLSTLAPAGWPKKPLGYLLIGCYGLYFSLAVCIECNLFG